MSRSYYPANIRKFLRLYSNLWRIWPCDLCGHTASEHRTDSNGFDGFCIYECGKCRCSMFLEKVELGELL